MDHRPETVKEALNYLKSFNLLDSTDLVLDELAQALDFLPWEKQSDIVSNLWRAQRRAAEVYVQTIGLR